MSFLRPKIKQVDAPEAPQVTASPLDLTGSMMRARRLKGGRNSFGASQASTAATASGGVGAKPNVVTGVNP